MIKSIKETIMERDNLPEEEVMEMIEYFKDDLRVYINDGYSLSEIQEIFMYDFGLEPDYLQEILFDFSIKSI